MLSPSSLHRAMECNASARDEERFPDRSAPSAVRGTRMHLALLFPAAIGDVKMLTEECLEVILDPTETRIVFKAFEQIRKAVENNEAVHEQAVDLAPWGVKKSGREGEHQADFVWLDKKGELHVLDFKSGKTPVPHPSENKQLFAYALGLRKEFKPKGKLVHLHICQPAISAELITGSATWDSITEFGKELKGLTERLDDPEYSLNYRPSPEACRWCKAAGSCEAKRSGMSARQEVLREMKNANQALISASAHPVIVTSDIGDIVVLDAAAIDRANDLLAHAEAIALPQSATEAEAAGTLLKEVTSFESAVEKNRTTVKRPILELGKAVDEAARKALAPLAEAKARLKDGLNEFVAGETRKRVAEAQELARAEIARIAALPKKKQAEALAAPVLIAKAPEAIKVAGVVMKEVKRFMIVGKIPAEYLVVDTDKIDRDVKSGVLVHCDWLKVTTTQEAR